MILPTKYQLQHHDIHKFLHERADWIHDKYSKIHKNIPFQHGTKITIEDVNLTIKYLKNSQTKTHINENELIVSGNPKLISRKIKEFLKNKTKQRMTKAVNLYTQKLNIKYTGKIIISNNKRSWGSCNFNSKNLSFNWRLILAPTYVADHVAAHEVAHLVVPNHSPSFYQTLLKIEPEYHKGNKWLQKNSSILFAYSRE